MSPVSTTSSRAVYDALKASGVRLMSALPETWLVHPVALLLCRDLMWEEV